MLNALTIDVEDYFNVSGFESNIKFEDWGNYQSRVEANTDKILEILLQADVKATFFILGWISEKYPDIVRRIYREGHEVASHSYAHRLVYRQTPEEFREDLRRSKSMLEKIIGDQVIGYRAPSYSITKKSLWAMDILMEEGILYDSSIFPIRRDRYGIPNANRFPYTITGKNGVSIVEVPLSTVTVFNQNIPIAGGGYLRLFPYRFIRWGLRKIIEQEKQSIIIYLHPWEIDKDQPRMEGSTMSRFRHYICLEKMEPRLRELLRDFKFGTVKNLFLEYQSYQKA